MRKETTRRKKLLALLLTFCMVLGMAVPVMAGNGPTTGSTSSAYVILANTSSQVLYSNSGKVDAVEGAVYDKDTNTITLTNYNQPEMALITNEMGEDLKLKLVGENHIQCLVVWGFFWGGSLEIIGDGSLTINEKKEADEAIRFMAEETQGLLKVGPQATLTAYKGAGEEAYVAMFYNTSSATFPLQGKLETEITLTTGSGVELEARKSETIIWESTSNWQERNWEVATKGDDGKKYGIKFGSIVRESETKCAWLYELVKVEGLASGNEYVAAEIEQIEGCTEWPSEYTLTGEKIRAREVRNGSMPVLDKDGETFYWGVDEVTFPPGGGVGTNWYSVYKALDVELTVKDSYGMTDTVTGKLVVPVEGMRNLTDDRDAIPEGYTSSKVKTGFYNYYCTNDVIKISPAGTSTNVGGNITLSDVTKILKIALNIIAPTDGERVAADVDGNGKVELADAVAALKLALGILTLG